MKAWTVSALFFFAQHVTAQTPGTAQGAFFRRHSANVINLTISANTQNYNIFTAAGSPSAAAAVNVTINSGLL